QICLLAEGGEVIERRIRTEPQRFAEALGGRATAQVLLESSTEREWVARCLEALWPPRRRRRPELRAHVCHPHSQGENRTPRRPRAARGVCVGALPPGAPALRCPAPCRGPPHRPGCAGADSHALHLAHPRAVAAARLAGALGQRRGVSAAGDGPAPARAPAL